jgi:hypothetical protein
MLASLYLARLSVATRVPETIENSGNAGSHHRSLSLPTAKFRLLEIRPCRRHGFEAASWR